MIGLELAFHLWASGRWPQSLLHHSRSLLVATEPRLSTTGLQHAACSCGKHISMLVSMKGKIANHSRKNPTTSVVVGRWAGYCCQQLRVMPHTESTRPSSCASRGRTGRSPSIILNITEGEFNSLNGCLPVKTYNGVQRSDGIYPFSPDDVGGGRCENLPLLQPCQRKKRLLPA
jgi:hypothetical protein